jgi:hypothetical protein
MSTPSVPFTDLCVEGQNDDTMAHEHQGTPARLARGTAATAYRAENRAISTPPLIECFAGALQLTYQRPTTLAEPLLLRATIRERTERKTIVGCTLPPKGKSVCGRR